MKPFLSITAMFLPSVTNAVNMTNYVAAPQVEPAFKSYLQQLYQAGEDPSASTSFTNFFTSNGVFSIPGASASGSTNILALKRKLVPQDGSRQLNHRPEQASVYFESTTQKGYMLTGVIDTTVSNVNCSRAYYFTHFNITKANGVVQLTPHQNNLALYGDYVVEPVGNPETNIPCFPY